MLFLCIHPGMAQISQPRMNMKKWSITMTEEDMPELRQRLRMPEGACWNNEQLYCLQRDIGDPMEVSSVNDLKRIMIRQQLGPCQAETTTYTWGSTAAARDANRTIKVVGKRRTANHPIYDSYHTSQ